MIQMVQTNVNIRMDEVTKKQFEMICNELGLNMSTAFNIFAKTVVRQQKIPFELSIDPFFSDFNQTRLLNAITNRDKDTITKTMEELEAMAGNE